MPANRSFSDREYLVTGATGFVGLALTRALLAAEVPKHRLRCLVRDPRRAVAMGIPAESVRAGALAVENSADSANGTNGALADAAAGVDVVFHLAGVIKAWHRSGYAPVNAGGTASLVRALEANGAPLLVHVSSLAAAGPSCDGADSAAPPERCKPVSAYGESKRDGERAVTASRLRWTIVRPPVVYGPDDAATRLLVNQACAPLCAVPIAPRPLSVVHVKDLVQALLLAASGAAVGRILPIDGPERTDTHAFVRAIATACGKRARLLPMPMPIAAAAAFFCDAFARVAKRPWFFNGDKLREIRACGWVADGAPAREALGFAPRIGLREGLLEVARAEGRAPAAAAATSATA